MKVASGAKPSTSKLGKLTRAKASKKPGHEIQAPCLGEFRRGKLFFSACPVGLCAMGDSYAIFLLLLKGNEYDDENLERGPFSKAIGFF